MIPTAGAAFRSRLIVAGSRSISRVSATIGGGIVEHQMLDAVELRVRMPQVIEQAPGRRDENVHTRAKGMLLRSHTDAAEDRRGGDWRVHRELLQLLEDLRRELSRRGENERARRAAWPVHQTVQDRQQKGGGLTATGHRAGQHVTTSDSGRNGVDLNGCRAAEAQLLDAAQNLWVQLE